MHISNLLLMPLLAGYIAEAHLPSHPSPRSISKPKHTLSRPTAQRTAIDIATSDNVLILRKTPGQGNPRSAAYVSGLNFPPGNSTTLISLFEGEEFATDIEFAGTSLEVIVDTGSSDTWVVESNFSCVNVETSAPETQAYCAFGPTYDVTDAFQEIPGETFNITYGDGEFLGGVLGYEEVTLAGITVNQTVAIVDFAAWDGDNTTSGLVGLAYAGM